MDHPRHRPDETPRGRRPGALRSIAASVIAAVVAGLLPVAVQAQPAAALTSAMDPARSRVAVEGPAPTPTPPPGPWDHLDPTPQPGPFQMDLYTPGVLASQAKPTFCVPAAMLTMINIMRTDGPITAIKEQKRLRKLARKHSSPRLRGAGAEPVGWAKGLNKEGFGRYVVHSLPRRKAAIKEAARALRFTGRPVGVLAWRGAHAWVITGFRATADPAYTRHFAVTHVVVADVWYPRVSSIWGPSDPPGTAVPFELLHRDILPWRRPGRRYPKLDGRFVLVLPVLEDGSYDPRPRPA